MRLGEKIRYLREVEGARPHLTNTSRMLLAKFFISDLGALEDRLDLWLIGGAERFRKDPGVCEGLLALAKHPDSRRCLTLLKLILENPGLADRLFEVLKPKENV